MIDKTPINQIYYLSPDGERYYFWYLGAGVLRHTNFGMPDIRFIEDSGPNQHGTTVRDWRAETRTITLDIWRERTDCLKRDCSLADIIDIVRPNRSNTAAPGWLRVVTNSQVMREIPVRVSRGPAGSYDYTGPVGSSQLRDTIQFYCADPIWRNVTPQSISLTTDGVTNFDAGCLDICLPGCIGSSVFNAALSVRYCGTWDADQITITLTGPLGFPSLENVSTEKTIQLDYFISSGEVVTITVSPESATIVNNVGANLIGTVTNISDLVQFTLGTRGTVAGGINELNFNATDAVDGVSTVDIQYYVRHISVYGESCEVDCVDGVIV